MPQTRTVTLNYDPDRTTDNFGPAPKTVRVKPGDLIEFRIGDSTRTAKPGCKLRITLHRAAHFSQQVLRHGAGQSGAEALVVTVQQGLTNALAGILAQPKRLITGYKCELLDANGTPIPGLTADGDTGGEIVPDTGVGGS